jgi:hypothetical protein
MACIASSQHRKACCGSDEASSYKVGSGWWRLSESDLLSVSTAAFARAPWFNPTLAFMISVAALHAGFLRIPGKFVHRTTSAESQWKAREPISGS